MAPVATQVRAYLGKPEVVVESEVASQGYHQLGFAYEQRKHAKDREKRGIPKNTKVLSPTAKALIKGIVGSKGSGDVYDPRGPTYMPPSIDKDQYSNWCSKCCDFGVTLILCAGCRVGICAATEGVPLGCLPWNPIITSQEFVFYCPWCCLRMNKNSELSLSELWIAGREDVWFRYDSPTLIVSITWHETKAKFGRLLHDKLCISYFNNHASLLWVDLELGSGEEDSSSDADSTLVVGGLEAVEAHAQDFLRNHLLAKIIVVIDTHCAENGSFVYKSSLPGRYETCQMDELLKVIPQGIRNFLTDHPHSTVHNHKSLIVNLACGHSVNDPSARRALLKGHCADAVLSLANASTVVGMVDTTLIDLCARWAQSSGDYRTLIHNTMKPEWAMAHRPVLSRQGQHTLYTKWTMSEPRGMLVVCHLGCGDILTMKYQGQGVRFICRKCNSRCYTGFYPSDTSTILGKKGFVETTFPQERYRTEWKLEETWKAAAAHVDAVTTSEKAKSKVKNRRAHAKRLAKQAKASMSAGPSSSNPPSPQVIARSVTLPEQQPPQDPPSLAPLTIQIPPRPRSAGTNSPTSTTTLPQRGRPSADPRKRPTVQDIGSVVKRQKQ